MFPSEIPFALGLLSVSVLTLVAAQLFSIAQAPGWARARSFAWVVATAALYGVVYTLAAAHVLPAESVALRVSAYLFIGTANAATWLWHARMPEARSWRDLPKPVIWHILVVAVVVSAVTLTGNAVDAGHTVRVTKDALGADYDRPLMSTAGRVSALLALSLFLATAHALWRRRVERGMPLIIVGYLVFFGSIVLELGIGMQGWSLVLPAPVGFLIAVVPVGLQFQQGVLRDAERLAWLSSSLQGQLASRTEERDAAREALVRQDRVASIGRLASGLAHELSNPLQHAALSVSELEALPSMATGQERRLLHEVATGVDRMQDIVHRLHDLVEHAEWHRERVSLGDAVRHAVALTAPQWRELTTVEITEEPTPAVSGNEAAVVRAVTALLINAADAVRRGPPLRPRRLAVRILADAGGMPAIEVLDSGPGFAEEVLAFAGEPFITGGETPGLGLFLVHRIMRAHGGRVVIGNRPDHGARVALQFPAVGTADERAEDVVPALPHPTAGGASRPEDPGAAPPAPVQAATILIVDDEPLVRNAFSRVLERAGHHVLRASDGREALDLLRTDIVDLVITDLMMPGMNGVEFAGVLAEGYPSLREHLVVICGGAVTQDAVEFLATPGLRVLNKPVSPADLVAVASTALAEREVSEHRGSPSSLRP